MSQILKDRTKTDVIITTYEQVKGESTKRLLRGIIYNSVIFDEGHRIKNKDSLIAKACRNLKAQFWLILTGTPIQNNLHEIWVLLNFLCPDIFTKSKVFDESFDLTNEVIDRDALRDAHYVMRPFVLRRLKSEVEQKLPPRIETKITCPMTSMQRFWIQHLLYKQRDAMAQAEKELMNVSSNAATARRMVSKSRAMKKRGNSSRLNNLLMALRSACNHPYLFDGVESVAIDGQPTQEIVNASGKMVVLEKLVHKLLERGHRIVIFSQFTRMLDIISDYFSWKGIETSRLDGSTNRVMREVLITQFNKPKSETDIFLLSTRAGGEGVNLASADTIILFDSDWNPQVDNQAMARVHRIGQTKTVHVYRLVISRKRRGAHFAKGTEKTFLDGMINRGSTSIAKALDEKLTHAESNKGKSSFSRSSQEDGTEIAKSESKDNLSAMSKVDHGSTDIDLEEELSDDDVFSILKFGWNSVFPPARAKARKQARWLSQMLILS